MQTEWKEFKATPHQIYEMVNAINGFIVRYIDGSESDILFCTSISGVNFKSNWTHYLICKPVAHAKIAARYMLTGQPVQYRSIRTANQWHDITSNPQWRENTEYRFKPIELKEKCYYRNYLVTDIYGKESPEICTDRNAMVDIESNGWFVRWLGDWQEA